MNVFMNYQSIFFLSVLLLLVFTACNEDTTSAALEMEVMGVFIENSGTSDLIIRQAVVTFCYESSGCIESNVANYTLPPDAGAPVELGVSDADLIAVGAIVTFQAVTGSGSIELVQGSPISNSEFDTEEILKTAEFGSGEIVTIRYGQTEF